MKKVLFFWVTVFICVQTNAQEKRPNIILFLVDEISSDKLNNYIYATIQTKYNKEKAHKIAHPLLYIR